MSLVESRGFGPTSTVAADLAVLENSNQQWGHAVARLRLLEREIELTFQELEEAHVAQREAGNGVGEPVMTAAARAAWLAYRNEAPEPDFDEPPILNWQDP